MSGDTANINKASGTATCLTFDVVSNLLTNRRVDRNSKVPHIDGNKMPTLSGPRPVIKANDEASMEKRG